MLESQKHEFVGDAYYCAQCPNSREHWVHQIDAVTKHPTETDRLKTRVDELESRLSSLSAWLAKRAAKKCIDCSGYYEHDRCENEPSRDDFAEMAKLLSSPTPKDPT